MRTKELREKRAKIFEEMQALLAKASLTAEDNAKFDALASEDDQIKAQIDKHELAARIGSELNARVEVRANVSGVSVGQQADTEVRETQAFQNWMRRGMARISPEEQEIMQRRSTEIRADMGVGTGAGGGFLVPQAFSDMVEIAMKAYGGMLNASDVFDTSAGADMPWPTVNDTSNVGELLAENVATATQDVTIASTTFKSYVYSSKLIPVSVQLLQDSAFDMQSFLTGIIGERLGRIMNQHFTTGTGTGQPSGVVTGATSGKVGTTGQTTSVIYDDLVDLEHSVDPAYRAGAIFMMHDSSLKVVKKLKDSQNRPLWLPGLTEKSPDTILGYPYAINQDVAVMAANAKSILFGEFKKYKIRRIKGVELIRLNERFAEKLQVGFFGFARYDGRLLDAGLNPIKYYANSAT